MANVLFAGLEAGSSGRLSGLLDAGRHQIHHSSHDPSLDDVLVADIVFVGGKRAEWMGLLAEIRAIDPWLPVVVAPTIPDKTDWLDALEAGASEYCAMPFDAAQVLRAMESARQRARAAVA